MPASIYNLYGAKRPEFLPAAFLYLYNGKELQSFGDLDYGARRYDPALGIFRSVDPLAEKYFSYSPFAYVLNNPLRNVDPDGRGFWDAVASFFRPGVNDPKEDEKFHGPNTVENTVNKVNEAVENAIEEINENVTEIIEQTVETIQDNQSSPGQKIVAGAAAMAGSAMSDGPSPVGDFIGAGIFAYTAVKAIYDIGSGLYDSFSKGGKQRIIHDPEALEKAKGVLANPNSTKKEKNAAKRTLRQQGKGEGSINKQKRNEQKNK